MAKIVWFKQFFGLSVFGIRRFHNTSSLEGIYDYSSDSQLIGKLGYHMTGSMTNDLDGTDSFAGNNFFFTADSCDFAAGFLFNSLSLMFSSLSF